MWFSTFLKLVGYSYLALYQLSVDNENDLPYHTANSIMKVRYVRYRFTCTACGYTNDITSNH